MANVDGTSAVGIACAANAERTAGRPGLPRVARCGAGNVKARVAGGGTARRSVGTTADRHVIGRLMAPVKTGAIPAAARNRHHATGLCERVT